MALFNHLHASAMEELGFPLTAIAGSAEGVVGELAASAARLHKMYLEQLTRLGRADAIHQERIRSLSAQIRDLSREVERKLEPQLKTRLVQLAWSFGDSRSRTEAKPDTLPGAPVQVSQANGPGSGA
jgi:hypothetical protein